MKKMKTPEENFKKGHKLYYEENNYEKAMKYFQRNLQTNHHESIFNIGRMYENGHGVEIDGKNASYYYRIAIEHGSSKALVNLASLLIEGKIVEKDQDQGMELYEKACELNDIYAIYNISLIYYEGVVREKDIQKALFYLEKGAKLNHPRSYNFLGCLFIEGSNVPRDYMKAIECFEKAAELNDKDALFNLGIIHDDIGSKGDALKYFEKGALLGSGNNAFKAALFYEKGEIVKQNLNKSRQYFKIGMTCKKSKEKEANESQQGFLRTIGMIHQQKIFKEDHFFDCIFLISKK